MYYRLDHLSQYACIENGDGSALVQWLLPPGIYPYLQGHDTLCTDAGQGWFRASPMTQSGWHCAMLQLIGCPHGPEAWQVIL